MKKTLRFLMLFAIGLFLALSVTSCGDDDDDDGTSVDTPAKTFTVTFNTDGGSEVVAQNVEEDKTATKPENPKKDGFYFLGWYAGDNLYDFSQPVSNDLTITALWVEEVDLGLPSGTIWAACNVGAKNPWDFGDYFAWGETTSKSNYLWATLKYCEDNNGDSFSKYNTQSEYGNVDNKTTLERSDDAATANWGSDWCMPTQQQFQELKDNCTWTWTTRNGKNGCEVKGKNGNSIFFPAAGDRSGTYLFNEGSNGSYWSSSLRTNKPDDGRRLSFYSDVVYPDGWCDRTNGLSVRPVRCK